MLIRHYLRYMKKSHRFGVFPLSLVLPRIALEYLVHVTKYNPPISLEASEFLAGYAFQKYMANKGQEKPCDILSFP